MADSQNPWFTNPTGSTTTNSTTGGTMANLGQPANAANLGMTQAQFDWTGIPANSTIVSQGPSWAQPHDQHNLSEVLDPSKWQNWSDDDWRLWSSGIGKNDGIDTGLLANGMTDSQIHQYANAYGAGNGHAAGNYDWNTKTWNYGGIDQATIDAANAAAHAGAGNPNLGQMTGGVGQGLVGPRGVVTGGPGGQWSNYVKPFTDGRPQVPVQTTGNRPLGTNVGGPVQTTAPTGRPMTPQQMQLMREAALIEQAQQKKPITPGGGLPHKPSISVGSRPNFYTPLTRVSE